MRKGMAAWKDNKGYITLDKVTLKILEPEPANLTKVLITITSNAFTRPIPVRQPDNRWMIWGEGSRPWSLRDLAAKCNMAINTLQKCLYRLQKLGLIRRVSNKLGTVIQAIRFYQYRRMNPHVDPPFDKGHCAQATPITHMGDTPMSEINHYRSGIKLDSTKLTSYVDVKPPALDDLLKKESQNPQILAIVRSMVKSVTGK